MVSIGAGSGALSGTTSLTVSSGVVNFSDLSYDTAEADVQIRATFGTVTSDSAAFTVGALPPGACQREDSYFATAGGGCTDLSTGLVWSARMDTTWYNAVWDEALAGNAGSDDANDYGRKNDYANNLGTGFNDNSTTNNCHDLVEGGQSDWRMATLAQFSALFDQLTAGTRPYLDVEDTNYIWSSDSHSNSSLAYRILLSTGATSNGSKTTAYKTHCVRGGIDATLSLNMDQSPSHMEKDGTAVISRNPFTIQLKDSGGVNANAPGVSVTVSSDLGTLTGTTVAVTDVVGIATFDDIQLDTLGSATLSFSATDYTTITTTVDVTEFAQRCINPSGAWINADGGCKFAATDLVFSLDSTTSRTWHEVVWGYVTASFNLADPPDGDDGGAEDDYDNSSGSTPDSSVENYCHALVESGFSDWRPMTNAEYVAIGNAGYTAIGNEMYFDINTSTQYFWTSTTHATETYAYRIRFGDGYTTPGVKSSSNYAICVRNP